MDSLRIVKEVLPGVETESSSDKEDHHHHRIAQNGCQL